ncbi:MAG: AAA family ATPase [Chloroflexota bacterium]
MLRPLPVSTGTFRKIIESGTVYVDKTRYMYELIQHPTAIYFLSRPRRFGKTLTVSALDEIFQGNQELFKGLWIDTDTDYDWPVHPVIRLDFSATQVRSVDEVEQVIDYEIQRIARENRLDLFGFNYATRFQDLIRQLSTQAPVVILIDEYDKPILDNITDTQKAKDIQDLLRGFYGVVKALEAHIRFVFITGISKFSKVGIFSQLNNLLDITLDYRYATMFGITQQELEHNFAEYMNAFANKEGLSRSILLEKIRIWYNGFRFSDIDCAVYNPYSTVLLFDRQKFSGYWFETGTPTFLIQLIQKRNFDLELLEDLKVSEHAFSTYEVGNLAIVPLLFQTGYLTIRDYDQSDQTYELEYPNYEVENAFLTQLLSQFSETEQALSESHLRKLVSALYDYNLERFFEVLKVVYANIDYDLQLDYEKYSQSIFFLIFRLIGIKISAEVKTNKGRIDAVVELAERIYLFEFKINATAEIAMEQIKQNSYFQKYLLHDKSITLVGVNFSTTARQVDSWDSIDLSTSER